MAARLLSCHSWMKGVCNFPPLARFLSGNASGMYYGQATASSHPELMQAGDVTPGLTQAEYQQRRHALKKILTHSAATIPTARRHVVAMVSAKQLFSAPEVPCEFRQCADFRYLSGFLEAKSVLLLEWDKTDESARTTLFVSGRSAKARLWDGPRTSLQDILKMFSVDKVLPIERLHSYLDQYYPTTSNTDCILWHSSSSIVDSELNDVIKSHFSKSAMLSSLLPHLHQQRVVKSPAELRLMRRAAQVTHAGFMKMMRSSTKPVAEWMLNSQFLSGIVDSEAHHPSSRVHLAFPCVIAGGCRATVLHYLAKDMHVNSDQLVLVDAGAELDGYVCDQSRTWPISGSFTTPQKLVYEAVLDVHKACLNAINKTGMSKTRTMTLDSLHDIAMVRMDLNLRTIGLIPSSISHSESLRVTRQLFPHALGHYVGADVHDCKEAVTSLPLLPGTTLTIEPGAYIAPDSAPAWVPSQFHGVGVRVEDTIAIDSSGCAEILTKTVKSTEDIEEHLRENRF